MTVAQARVISALESGPLRKAGSRPFAVPEIDAVLPGGGLAAHPVFARLCNACPGNTEPICADRQR